MGIKAVTSNKEIAKLILSECERVEMLTVRALSYLGEMCVKEARDRPQEESWIDRTGNLRSSVGYVIAKNGKVIGYSGFTRTLSASDGVFAGKSLAEEIALRSGSGYVLVVVAGMNYAEYVEAMDNKVVLASAELLARRELPNMMRKLKTQIAK